MNHKFSESKILSHERRKALWRSRVLAEKEKSEFRKSILQISADIDAVFYGHRKVIINSRLH